MAINYKAEVDSGYDRKILQEKMVMNFLEDDIPLNLITENKLFNFKHLEMVNNLKNRYEQKLKEYERIYGDVFDVEKNGLSLSFTEIRHDLQELYPMTSEEEKKAFKKLDSVKKEIKLETKKEKTRIENERKKVLNKIVKFKLKHPEIDRILELVMEMDLIAAEKTLTKDILDELFTKYGFNKKTYTIYDLIYNEYNALLEEVNLCTKQLDLIEQEKYCNDSIRKLIIEKNKLEEEIISRNIKLVNYFLRIKYTNLLVESEEMYDTCLIAMAESVRSFDVSLGYKFSTYAFKFMDQAIKHNFKELTGYNWYSYYRKRMIDISLKTLSDMLERPATIKDLVEFGAIAMTETNAETFNNMPSIILDSYLYDEADAEKMDITFEDYEMVDSYEDERYGNNSSYGDEVEEEALSFALKDIVSDVLFTLTDRERLILVLRFGLDRSVYMNDQEQMHFKEVENGPRTLTETAKLFNVTRERIRQIEAKALRKLRHPSRSKNIRGYI